MTHTQKIYTLLQKNNRLQPYWTKSSRKGMREFLNEEEMVIAKKIIEKLQEKEILQQKINNADRNFIEKNGIIWSTRLGVQPQYQRLANFKIHKKWQAENEAENILIAQKEQNRKNKISASRLLKKAGFNVKSSEFNGRKSSYYASKCENGKWTNIRISDHEIPMTEARLNRLAQRADFNGLADSAFCGDFEIIFDAEYGIKDFQKEFSFILTNCGLLN